MTVRAPDAPGLSSLNLPQDGRVDTAGSQRIAGLGQERSRGGVPVSAIFDGEAVLAADVWEGGAARSLPQARPAAYANGPDLSANIERDVDYILSPLF